MIEMAANKLQIAANQDKLLIGIEGTNNLEIWDLQTLNYKAARLPDDVTIRAMAVGWNSSDAPLLVFTPTNPRVVFFDINSLTRLNIRWKQKNPRGYVLRVDEDAQFSLHSSADGTTFTSRRIGYSSSNYIVQWHGTNASFLEKSLDSYLAPSPDGNVLYTPNKGVVSLDLKPKGIILEGQHLIPGTKGQFFLAVNNERENYNNLARVRVTIYRIADYHPVLTLDDLSEMEHDDWNRERLYYRQRLTEDKRYWLFPELNRLITIPYSNDRLVIRDVNLEP
jgi:hypothetical protein